MTPTGAGRRRAVRFCARGNLRIHWLDAEGGAQTELGKYLDLSRSGVCVQLPRPIAMLTPVRIEDVSMMLEGHAVVKHCVARESFWIAGLEFDGETARHLPLDLPAKDESGG